MATVGLDAVYVGLKNGDGSVIVDAVKGLAATGAYKVDTNKSEGNLGTKSANITNIAGTPTKYSGNNEVVDSSKPHGYPSVAWDANDINPTVLHKLLGDVLETGGWVEGDTGTEAGLIICSERPSNGEKVYFAFGRGQFTKASQNIQTNTDTAETREDDNLTFTSFGYDKWHGRAMKTFYEKADGFDMKAMFDEVFPGQTLIAASKAS